MADDTLLLRIRAEALSANFERLKRTLLAVPSRLEALQKLDKSLDAISKDLVAMRKEMIDFETKITQATPELNSIAETVIQEIGAVRAKVIQVKTDATNIQKACFHVNETPVAGTLASALKQSTDPLLVEIAAVTKGSVAVGADFRDLWKRLTSTAQSEIPILSDFMELMGGVALRDARFDEGISELADELLRAYIAAGGKADFVAIPMRDQALLNTFARIVRVTFPDWTLWSLPNTALEFWHSIAAPGIQGPLDTQIGTMQPALAATIQAEDRKCLGDGYAVFTMGPAYAYCAVTLMLNPMLDAHHRRVRAILAMLECMDTKEGPGLNPYRDTRAQLLSAGVTRDEIAQSKLALYTDYPSSAATSDPEGNGTRLLMKTFADVLSRVTSPGFVAVVWDDIRSWVDPLLDGDVSKARINIPRGAELRHVFNAAWIARTHPDRQPNIVDLTETVRQLRDRVRSEGK
jgi:hypothetical protein